MIGTVLQKKKWCVREEVTEFESLNPVCNRSFQNKIPFVAGEGFTLKEVKSVRCGGAYIT